MLPFSVSILRALFCFTLFNQNRLWILSYPLFLYKNLWIIHLIGQCHPAGLTDSLCQLFLCPGHLDLYFSKTKFGLVFRVPCPASSHRGNSVNCRGKDPYGLFLKCSRPVSCDPGQSEDEACRSPLHACRHSQMLRASPRLSTLLLETCHSLWLSRGPLLSFSLRISN